MLKDLIKKKDLQESVTFTWKVNGEEVSRTIKVEEIDNFVCRYQPTNGKGEFIVENKTVYIKWSDFDEDTELLDPRNNCLNETELIHKDLSRYINLLDKLNECKFDLSKPENENIYTQIMSLMENLSSEKENISDNKFVNVTYRSCWAEGIVDTSAKINLETGEIVDIESSEEGINYEFHEQDCVYFTNNIDDGLEMIVENDLNGFMYAITLEDLDQLKKLL